tara:strand:- start:327 stop:959 length:633 start_codon:yes stop_codon:yes gene_type:complete
MITPLEPSINPEYRFYYWGPLLFKIKISPFHLKACAKLCNEKEGKANDTLVGIIEHEYYINRYKYQEIINPYLNSFENAFQHWYGKPLVKNLKKLIMSKAWVNFMTAGEFNPPHIHDADLSSVLFIQVPKILKEEYKNFKERKQHIGKTKTGPGVLEFLYGEHQPYSISEVTAFPEEGDLYIFPATLTHLVFPFKSKGERISVGANFKLK